LVSACKGQRVIELFLAAFGMSLAFAIQPGIITFEAIRRGAARGWRAALHLELGSLIGDATWAILALVGASVLFQSPLIARVLSLFGCALLLRFAWDAWQASRQEIHTHGESVGGANDFVAGALLSLSNPSNITFWMGMSGMVIGLGFLDPQPIHLATFLSGFMLAQVLWCFFMAGVIGYGREILNPQTFRAVNVFSALILAYFGLTLLFDTVQMTLLALL
jgi:threonine/homoserine/homoserine lactone efflux protein